MSPNNNILGANVRRLRKNRGMTQKGLGKAVFHEETWISKLENGHLTPSPEDCLKLAQTLRCDLSELKGSNSSNDFRALHHQILERLTTIETQIEITETIIQALETDLSALNEFSSFFAASLKKHFLVILLEKLRISHTNLAERLGVSVSLISKSISNDLPISENLSKKISLRIKSFLFFKGFSTPKEFLDFYKKDLAECRLNLIKLRDSLHEEKIALTASDETLIKMSFDSENSDN